MLAAYAALFVALQRINSSIGPKGKHTYGAKHHMYVTLWAFAAKLRFAALRSKAASQLHNCYAHMRTYGKHMCMQLCYYLYGALQRIVGLCLRPHHNAKHFDVAEAKAQRVIRKQQGGFAVRNK